MPCCAMTKIKKRSQSLLAYRCHNQTCKLEFDTPVEECIEVTTYRSQHSNLWYDLFEELDAKALRLACVQPKAQFSMRLLDWQKFENSLATPLRYQTNNINSFCTKRVGTEPPRHGSDLAKLNSEKNAPKVWKCLRNFWRCPSKRSRCRTPVFICRTWASRLSREGFFEKGPSPIFDLGLIAVEPNSLKIQLADSLQAIPSIPSSRQLPRSQYQQKTTGGLKAHWMEHGASLTEK